MYNVLKKSVKKAFLITVLVLKIMLGVAQQPLFTTNALLLDNQRYLLSNKGNQSVIMIDQTGKKLKEWNLNEPVTGLCLNGNTVYATSSGDKGFLTAFDLLTEEKSFQVETGLGATNPLVSANGSIVYVFNQYKNTVCEVDAHSGKVLRNVSLLREPLTGVLSLDGKYLFVNNFLPAQRADVDYVSAEVSVVDLVDFSVVKNIRLANGSNALRGICISPDGMNVYVSHNLGRFQVPTSQLQQGWMNTSALSVIDTKNLSYVGSILLDEPDRGAAGIWGVACNDAKVFVAHSGTHDISIIDHVQMKNRLARYSNKSNLSYDLRFLYGIRKRLPVVGNGPRNISLAKGKLCVVTYFSDTLNVIDAETEKISTIACNPMRKESVENLGEKVFNDASHCYQNWQSCNGCHPGEARTDGMNWDLMNDGIGNPKNCKSLLLSHATPPSMISGIRPSAEYAVRAGFKFIQFSDLHPDLAESVDAYLKSLKPMKSPYLKNGELTQKAIKGRKVFDRLGCGYCHSGPSFTDMKKHHIGDKMEHETGWDTPTLIEIWRTAPYLFDGRAATLKEVFSACKHGINDPISEKEIDEMVEYINSL